MHSRRTGRGDQILGATERTIGRQESGALSGRARALCGPVALLAAAGWIAFLALPRLGAPFGRGLSGDSGAALSAMARNLLRYGPAAGGFLPVANTGEARPEEFRHGVQHPPLTPYLIAGAFAVAGESEGAARAVPLLMRLSSLALLFLLARRIAGRGASAAAVLIFAALPVTGRFADFVEYQCAAEPAILAAFLAFDAWRRSPGAGRLALLLAASLSGWLADWGAFLLVPLLSVHVLAAGPRRRSFLLLPAAGILTLGALVASFASAKARAGEGSSILYALFRASPDLDALRLIGAGWVRSFTLPVLLAGAAAIAWFAVRAARRGLGEREALAGLLFLSGFGYVALLPGLAAGHEFTALLLAPSLALAAGAGVAALPRPAALPALLGLLVFLGARSLAERETAGDISPALREIGEGVRELTEPAGRIASTDTLPYAVLYYADREVEPGVLDLAGLEEARARGATVFLASVKEAEKILPLLVHLAERAPAELLQDVILFKLGSSGALPPPVREWLESAQPLPAPADLTARQEGCRIHLGWTPPGGDWPGYSVYLGDGGARFPIGVLAGPEPGIRFDFLKAGTYAFRVAVLGPGGREGEPSAARTFEVREDLWDLLRRRGAFPLVALSIIAVLLWFVARSTRRELAWAGRRVSSPHR